MRILICNDDGINAEGLRILAESAKMIADEVYIAAPAENYSGAARKVTFFEPVSVYEEKIDWADGAVVAVGTPVDALCVALMSIYKEKKFDLVLSGINHGANLGHDVFYSGTVNLVLEAFSYGIPAIAFSQVGYHMHKPELLASWIAEFTKSTLKSELGKFCLNVNFPQIHNAEDSESLDISNMFNGMKFTLLSGYHHGDVFNEVGAGEDPKIKQFSFARNHKVAEQPENRKISDMPELLFDQEAIHHGCVSVTPLTDMVLNKEMIKKLHRNSSNFENL